MIKYISFFAVLLVGCSPTTENIPDELTKKSEKHTQSTPNQYNFSAPKPPTEIIFAGKPYSFSDEDIKERLDKELVVNTFWHSNTIFYMKRAHRWFPMISAILKQENVPDDFKYLAVIESGLKQATSPSGEKCFCQFMTTTAIDYELEISNTVDERLHLEKSTHAACKYLKKAYKKFGSWELAAAAYNRGSNGLERDMEEYDIEFIEKIQIYATNSPERAMVKIASKGWINLMRYLYAEWEEKYYEAEENGTEIDSIWSLAVADQAAWYGCYECLKFAIDKGCPTDPSVSTSAAWHGHIDCLKLLFSSGCNFNQDILEKAGNASRSGGGTDNGTDDDNGNEMCFKFAFENGAFIDEGAASSWAWNSNLKMLKWLKNEMEKKGKQIILSPRAIHGAVTTRSFECVEFLVKENCPMDEWVHLAAQNALNQYNNPNVKHKETFKEWIDASKKILQFLEESGCPLHVNE